MDRTTPRAGAAVAAAAAGRPLVDRVRGVLAARHYSRRTERAYVGWIRRFIDSHPGRAPETMGEAEITDFLTRLACTGRVSASTQNQAFSSLLFLYREVLGRELKGLDAVRAKPSVRLPIVLTRAEVAAVLAQLRGPVWMASSLTYGAGLRILGCLRLRIKDLDFGRNEFTVRDGKGQKDRVTVLPAALSDRLRACCSVCASMRKIAPPAPATWRPQPSRPPPDTTPAASRRPPSTPRVRPTAGAAQRGSLSSSKRHPRA